MQWEDEVIKHNINIANKSSKLGTQIEKELKELFDECSEFLEKKDVSTKKKAKDLELAILDIVIKYQVSIDEAFSIFANNTISSEKKWIEEKLQNKFEKKFRIPDSLKTIALSFVFSNSSSVNNFGKDLRNQISEMFSKIIQTSYATGTDLTSLVENSENRFNSFTLNKSYEAESTADGFSNLYDRLVYTKNEKIIGKYVWIAILDTSTCSECGFLNGTEYTDISKIPVYPLHRLCRCSLIPYAKNDVPDVPSSYAEWLEKQSDSDKEVILGKTRYSMYKNGMSIKKFYANNKKIPLKDLKH